MKTLAPLALILAMLGVPTSTDAAVAAPTTCQGKPATLVGVPGGTVAGTDGDDVVVSEGASTVIARGGDDRLCVTGSVGAGAKVSVLAGAGQDSVLVEETSLRDMDTVAGGVGRDRVIVRGDLGLAAERFVLVDLARAEVTLTNATLAYTFQVDSTEDAEVIAIPRAHVYGTDAANRLIVRAAKAAGLTGNDCRIIVTGRGGDDEIKVARASKGDCPEPRITGSQGDDVLIGSPTDDLIFGGPGRDTARGGKGHDLCRVEVALGCEGRPS